LKYKSSHAVHTLIHSKHGVQVFIDSSEKEARMAFVVPRVRAFVVVLCVMPSAVDAFRGFPAPAQTASRSHGRRSVLMESEMEYRRRMSGDPRYIAKAAEDTLDAASNEQAQRWLRMGGRTVTPPEDAASSVSASIEKALDAGARRNSQAVQRANALREALIAGPSSPAAASGLRPFSNSATSGMQGSILGSERSDDMLPGDFDGTRQGVARALLADRYRRQQKASASQVSNDTPTRQMERPQPPLAEPSASVDVVEEVVEEDIEDAAADRDTNSLDAKLDAIWSAGYAEPFGEGS
jgi:hypothetical protein